MASYDRKFEVLRPSLDRVVRDSSRQMASPTLLDPSNAASIIDGEFLQFDTSDKLIRVTNAAKPSFAVIDDRGDYGVQVHKRPTLLIGTYVAQTVVYASALSSAAFGDKLEIGAVNTAATGSQARTGLVAFTSNLVIGYVMKPVANGVLTYLSTLA